MPAPRLVKMLSFIVLALVLTVLATLWFSIDDWRRDFTHNHAATSPTAADAALRPIETDRPASELPTLVAAAARQIPRWHLSEQQPEGNGTAMHFIRTTRMWHFKDDIWIRIMPRGAGSEISGESQSRLGKGDFGQNPRNLKEILTAVRRLLDSPSETRPQD
jgi:uncharacterized protein (DUF1499 family)